MTARTFCVSCQHLEDSGSLGHRISVVRPSLKPDKGQKLSTNLIFSLVYYTKNLNVEISKSQPLQDPSTTIFSIHVSSSRNPLVLLFLIGYHMNGLLLCRCIFQWCLCPVFAFLTLHLFPFRSQHLLQSDFSGQCPFASCYFFFFLSLMTQAEFASILLLEKTKTLTLPTVTH